MSLKIQSVRTVALGLVLAAALAGCGEDLNKKGVAQLEARQFEAAAQTFREVLAKDKTNAEAMRNLVRANIELVSDANLAETRGLVASLRSAKREAEANELGKALDEKAKAGALAGQPGLSKHLVELFNAGEAQAFAVIIKTALANPASFEPMFDAMRNDKKAALVIEAVRDNGNVAAAAAVTHIVWRKAPDKATQAATLQAQQRAMRAPGKPPIDAAAKAVSEMPEDIQMEFYKGLYTAAANRSPGLAAAGAWLEAKSPATFVEWNILRIAGHGEDAKVNCGIRRVDAVTNILRSLEEGKPVAFNEIGGGWQQNIRTSSVQYLDAVRKAHDSNPDQKFEGMNAKDCLALYQRLRDRANP